MQPWKIQLRSYASGAWHYRWAGVALAWGLCVVGWTALLFVPNQFQAVAKMKVGPVSARVGGRVTLSDLDPPNGYRISGEGEGGVAGFAKGGAIVALTEKDGGTLLTYEVEAQIGGKLAQLGQRLISGSAKKLADQFFVNFANEVRASDA